MAVNRNRAAARHMLIRRLIDRSAISDQEELVRLLGRAGHRVTQATVSRDLAALGIEKVAGADGETAYALPSRVAAPSAGDGALRNMLRAFALDIDSAENLVVIKTPPGSANPVASALDDATSSEMLGSVAGDDTVLVIARSKRGATQLVRKLQQLIGGSR